MFRLALCLAVLTALAGCGDDRPSTPPMPDATVMLMDSGMPEPDTYVPPPPDPATCAMPNEVMGMIGIVSVMGDTTRYPAGALDLGACDNVDATMRSGQEVIAYTVPGTGPVGIRVRSDIAGTETSFDTIIQVRGTTCETVEDRGFAPTCFDDVDNMGNWRSAGSFTAMGGDTVYIVLAGWSETEYMGASDRGRFAVSIEARVETLPVISDATVDVISSPLGSRTEFSISGMDPDGDVVAFVARFLDDADMPVDISGDGMANDDDVVFRAFNENLMGMDPFTGTATIGGISEMVPDLGAKLAEVGGTKVELQVFDNVFGFSAPMTFTIGSKTEVGLDAACDADNLCVSPLECTADVCTAPMAVTDACATATAITIDTPTTTATTAMVSGTVEPGTGAIEGPPMCSSEGGTGGQETIYSVDVPAGSFDLIARTDLAGTGDTDTVLYARTNCADPLTNLMCNDDVDFMGMVYASSIEMLDVPTGTVTLFVEPWNNPMDPLAASAPFDLEITLRPVLAADAACDPAGVMNRCSTGACDATSMVCPPAS